MKYTALSPVAVHAGQLVKLTARQMERCAPLVAKSERKGWHEVVIGFHFKAGEAFELDAELPKGMADLVEERGAAAPSPAPTDPEQPQLTDPPQG